jgi:hypothetical protein
MKKTPLLPRGDRQLVLRFWIFLLFSVKIAGSVNNSFGYVLKSPISALRVISLPLRRKARAPQRHEIRAT